MSIFDRVAFDELVPDPSRIWDFRRLAAMISSIRTQGCVCNPLQVREVPGKPGYLVADGMLRYNALGQLPPSHPARQSIPIEIID